MTLSVSNLAQRARISADAVRYYGRLGLLPPSGRTSAGHRYYDEVALERLRFIKGAQWLDLSLDEIGELLRLWDGGTCACAQAEPMLRRRIATVDEQIGRLETVRQVLCRLLGSEPGAGNGEDGQTRAGPVMVEEVTSALAADSPVQGVMTCGCCQDAMPSAPEKEIEELQARLAAVDRRLRNVGLEQTDVGERGESS